MNLPNKLTILRVALIPVFVVFFLGSENWGFGRALRHCLFLSLPALQTF